MKLLQLNIQGFGKLKSLKIDFSPKLNLIWGLNEAGKSTLQQAILAAFYGFYQGSRATTAEKQQHLRFKPWTHADFDLQLVYELGDGHQFEIVRNFADDDIPTKIFDAVTGKDLTPQFKIRRHGNISSAREHLGMSREIFEATVFVRQAEVKSLQNNAGLVNEIVSLLDSGTTRASAEEAIAFLEGQIARVGSDRARVKRLPMAQEWLKKIQEEREMLLRDRDSLREAVLKKQDLEKTLQKDRTKLLQFQYLILDKRMAELAQNFKRSEAIRRRLKELRENYSELEGAGQVSDSLREGIVRKFQTLENQKEQIGEIREKIKQQQTIVEQLARELAEYTDMRKLSEFLTYEEFDRLQTRWNVADRALKRDQDEYEKELNRLSTQNLDADRLQKIYQLSSEETQGFREQEEELGRLDREIQSLELEQRELAGKEPFTKSVKLGIVGLAFLGVLLAVPLILFHLTATGVILGAFLITLSAGVSLYFSGMQNKHEKNRMALKHDLHEIVTEKMEKEAFYKHALQPFGVKDFKDLLEKRLQFESLSRKIDAVARSREGLAAVEFQLLKYLGSIDIQSLSEEVLQNVGAQFKSFFELKNQFDREKRLLEETRKDLARVQDRSELTTDSLLERLQEAGINEKDPDKALLQFKALVEKKKECDRLGREIEKLQSELNGLFAGKSEAELLEQQEAWTRRRDTLLAHHPELKGLSSGWSSQKLLTEYETLDQKRQEMEKEVERLEATIQTVLTSHRPQAEIEEELAAAEKEVRRLLKVRHALEKARDTLREVMESYHRDMAPFLNQTVGRGIQAVTRGRYKDVRIDPQTFTIHLVVPETGDMQPSDRLSLGTQEQLYLLLRVAVAKHLSENAESLPLILDDPFVHFDHNRLENVLVFLKQLSEQNQIIVFTKDRAIHRWVEKNVKPEDHIILELK
ncbi:chromosome segregation protein [bacterium BMS3Bbin03]|nr:chromosome segregation protein [bacterium BMS3Bbin03]